jgi:hypothetical protein
MEKGTPKERILSIRGPPTTRNIRRNIQAQSQQLKDKAQEQGQPRAANLQKMPQQNQEERGQKMPRRPDPAQLEAR